MIGHDERGSASDSCDSPLFPTRVEDAKRVLHLSNLLYIHTRGYRQYSRAQVSRALEELVEIVNNYRKTASLGAQLSSPETSDEEILPK